MKNRISAKLTARIGVLGALAALLYLIPGIPIIPPIYKLDISTLPVLLGGFSLGVWPGLVILLIKDLVGLLNSSSLGVGELADFMVSAAMLLPAVLIYRHFRKANASADKAASRKAGIRSALVGLLTGIAAMTAVGVLANYYIMIPFYVKAFHMSIEDIVAMIGAVIPAVDTLPKLILLATAPFNLLKGTVLTLLTFLLYKRLSPLLKTN